MKPTAGDITPVVFRKWYSGHIIALFPTVPSDVGGHYCSSFEHVGQHGQADYFGVVQLTDPANEMDYEELKRELEVRYGYKLKVCKRYGANKGYQARLTQLRLQGVI